MSNQLSSIKNGVLRFFGDRENEYRSLLVRKGLRIESKRVPTVNMVFAEQVHSSNAVCADPIISYCLELSSPLYLPECDAVVLSKKGHFAAIVTADCVPVLISDDRKKIVAAVHSGREGTRMNIIGNTLDLIFTQYGSRLEDISITLGPCIAAENYPVSSGIFAKFVSDTGIEQTYPYLDMKKVIKESIARKGITDITDIDICTFQDNRFFSYRRNKTFQRQISLIGVI